MLHGVHPPPLKKPIKKKNQHQPLINKLTKTKKKHTHAQTKNANKKAIIHTLLAKDDGLCMSNGQLRSNGQDNMQKHKTYKRQTSKWKIT